jgi:hypothetical protein
MSSRECYKAMCLRNFRSIHGARRSSGESKSTLKEMKSERKLKYPILGEVKPLKNRGIPRRNQEIATKGSRSLSTGVLESWGHGFPFIGPKRNLTVGVSETRICLGQGPDMSG